MSMLSILRKKKKQEPAHTPEYGAWCELVTILSREELEHLVIIESKWKTQVENRVSGRFNMKHYLKVVQYRRSA